MAVTVQNTKYDGGSIEINVDGNEFTGVESIGWGFSNEKVKIKGVGRTHTGQTVGFFSIDDGSLQIHHDEYQNWLARVGSPKAMTETEFEIVVKYIDENEELIKYTFESCRVISVASSPTVSDAGAIVVDVAWSALAINTD